MFINISNSSPMPIYEQIATAIKRAILTGELSQGEALPSMRMLAKELRISVITTKRAYEELEREGFITSVTGRGSFVEAPNLELIREERLRSIEEDMKKVIETASSCGLTLPELVEMMTLLYKGD